MHLLPTCDKYISFWNTYVYMCTNIHACNYQCDGSQKRHLQFSAPYSNKHFLYHRNSWQSPVKRLSKALGQSSSAQAGTLPSFTTSLWRKTHIWKLLWPMTRDCPLTLSSSPPPSSFSYQIDKIRSQMHYRHFHSRECVVLGAALKSVKVFLL